MVKTVTRYGGNFVACANQIAQAGQRMATAREGMLDRIADLAAKGRNSDYFSKGGWHSEGTARINGVNHWCLGKYAPTTNYAQETLEANTANSYLALTEEIKLGKKSASEVIQMIAEADAKKPAEQRRILIPTNQRTFSVFSETLGDVDIAKFLARDAKLAQKYGQLVKNSGIDKITFYQLSGDQEIPGSYIAAGFWLRGLCDGFNSDFSGVNIDFDNVDEGSSFGVRSRARVRETNVTPNSLPYTSREAKRYVKVIDDIVEGRVAPKDYKRKLNPIRTLFDLASS